MNLPTINIALSRGITSIATYHTPHPARGERKVHTVVGTRKGLTVKVGVYQPDSEHDESELAFVHVFMTYGGDSLKYRRTHVPDGVCCNSAIWYRHDGEGDPETSWVAIDDSDEGAKLVGALETKFRETVE